MIPRSAAYEQEFTEKFVAEATRAKETCKRGCGGSGVILLPSSCDTVSRRCECMNQALLENKLRRGNVPHDYWGEFHFEVGYTAVSKALLGGTIRGLLISGPPGSGKTTLACSILRQAAVFGSSIFRIEATELERALALAKGGHGWVDLWLQESMFHNYVCVDEVGAEMVRATCGREARAALSYFLKHRFEQEMPTVVCTNLSQEELIESYGASISSVLYSSKYVRVAMSETDRRK